MRFKTALSSLLLAAKGIFALAPGDYFLSGIYAAKAAAPFGTMYLARKWEVMDKDDSYFRSFLSPMAIPLDAQILAITIPDLWVLGGLASGLRGKDLRDRRIVARNAELGTAAAFLGLSIVAGAAGVASGHGGEIGLAFFAITFETVLLVVPTLAGFPAEERGRAGDAGPDPARITLRVPF